MNASITREVLEGYIHCKYKAYLILMGEHGDQSDYELLRIATRDQVQRKSIETIHKKYPDQVEARALPLTASVLAKGAQIILEASIVQERVDLLVDGLQQIPGESALGTFHYIPILFTEDARVRAEHRLLIEIYAHLLAAYQGRLPTKGIIWLGANGATTTVQLRGDTQQVKRVLADLRRMCVTPTPPQLIVNAHCAICEFRQRCHDQALQEDNLSLLRGLSPKDITRYARKGILTVTQLAHTFRPRRSSKEARPATRRHFALQALAIRDQRIYIYGTPELPTRPVQIYFDVESDPDAGFVYLIGLVIMANERETRHAFWADTKEQESEIFKSFVTEVTQHTQFVVFCYGSLEREFLTRMRKTAKEPEVIDTILAALVNILTLIYTHVYFPTYSNGLKDIGHCIGAVWTAPDASGIQSIVWRARWVASGDDAWKRTLITYNSEDCLALKQVTEVLQAITTMSQSEPVASSERERPPVAFIQDVEKLTNFHTWRAVDFVHPDYEFVNSRAYFDYQRERIYVRTNPPRRKTKARTNTSPNIRLKASKRIKICVERCPTCQSDTVIHGLKRPDRSQGPRLKRAFDLVFTASGIQRRIIECRTSLHRCEVCHIEFFPDQHLRLDKHFHGLKSWAMFHHVNYQMSLAKLRKMIEELFGLRVFHSEMLMFKHLMARNYAGTYQQILDRMLAGPLLHVDETEVKLQNGKGYVWVITTLDAVIYLYRPNREGDFLHELLKGFHGVLVSDFYTVYDGMACPQQKCLIHLMRDMNQELLNNPFDTELKAITQPFGVLLRRVITTVDEHGLRRSYLQGHKHEVEHFFQTLETQTILSEAAEALRTRLLKYRDKLFTFLDYDGIPWNNNNAEHAIKQFAYYREQVNSSLVESGLNDYLVLLSVAQTCAYKGVSFLKFLLSKDHDIEVFCQRKRQPSPRFEIELYPEGFVPQHFASKKKKNSQQGDGLTPSSDVDLPDLS